MTASADPTRTRSGVRPWLITVAAVSAVIAAMWITAPGVDWREVHAAFLVGRTPILHRYWH